MNTRVPSAAVLRSLAVSHAAADVTTHHHPGESGNRDRKSCCNAAFVVSPQAVVLAVSEMTEGRKQRVDCCSDDVLGAAR